MTIQALGIALQAAGPWLTVAAISILLLIAVVKVVVIDHSMVPYTLLDAERQRTDKLFDAFDKVTSAVDQLTTASSTVLPLVQAVSDNVRELRRDVDDMRRGLHR